MVVNSDRGSVSQWRILARVSSLVICAVNSATLEKEGGKLSHFPLHLPLSSPLVFTLGGSYTIERAFVGD